MSEILIRRALPTDLPTIQEIARRTIDQRYRVFLGDENVDWYLDSGQSDQELQQHLDSCDLLLINNSIAAFSIYFDDLIHLMMVDVALHRTGLGTKLLQFVELQLFQQGNQRIRLETFDGNTQAINFYQKNGWQNVDRLVDEEFNFVRLQFEKLAEGSYSKTD